MNTQRDFCLSLAAKALSFGLVALITALLASWAGIASAQNITVTTTVRGTTVPWGWENGGLNTAYQFGYANYSEGLNGTAPTVISAANGFRCSVGDSLTISYLSGLISFVISPNQTIYDALGDTNTPVNQLTGGEDGVWPSYYMNPSTDPIYIAELVGTFADSSGQIVGTPFAIGDLGTLTVPSGATQLQLGVNDNAYNDNLGSWAIQVTGVAVPEPATIALVLMSVAAFGLATRGRQRSVRR